MQAHTSISVAPISKKVDPSTDQRRGSSPKEGAIRMRRQVAKAESEHNATKENLESVEARAVKLSADVARLKHEKHSAARSVKSKYDEVR